MGCSKRVDVLHVTECPGGGGVTRFIDQIITDTPELRHGVLAPPGQLNALTTTEVIDLPDGTVARMRTTRRAVARLRPRIVIAHSSLAGLYTRILPIGAPVLYMPHGYAFSDPSWSLTRRAAYWIVERVLAPRSVGTLTLGAFEERNARRLGAKRVSRIVHAPTITPPAVRASCGDATVVTAARICAVKDPELFARIARATQQLDPTIRFKWIGDIDTAKAGTSGMRAQLEAAGVEVTGWMNDDHALARDLSTASVYLHTATKEAGTPLSVLDAAACGIPILVRDIPAFEDTDVMTFSGDEAGVGEAARLILALTAPGEARDSALAQSKTLAEKMNRHERRTSLMEAVRPWLPPSDEV